LMLNPAAAAIPWELMHDGFDRAAEPLSVASGMIRQLVVQNERPQVLRSPSDTALVIGNPHLSDPRLPSLEGAKEEAVKVAELLAKEDGWKVELLTEEAATPVAVLTALHEQPWRVLHMAAHGVFEYGEEKVSGLVLDDGTFFTAADADQLRYVPELVFINCCHLGQTRGDAKRHVAFHRLAANLATQFIKMGARAVVAAGWEVDDAAATTFATRFYERMLGGELYGDAVLGARQDTYLSHGGTNTWGAYQCYGDPSFSLVKARSSLQPLSFVSETELSMWLESHAARAREAAGNEDRLLAQLEDCVARTPARWWSSADVCARAAEAFMELGAYRRAIGYYESVLRTEAANASIRSLEQLSNCKVRYAGRLLREGRPDRAAAGKLLDEAEELIGKLLALGETSERWSLLGGVHKCRAIRATAKEARAKALELSREAYGKAYDLASGNSRDGAYPLGNRIAAELVLSWNGNPKKGATKAISKALDAFDEAGRALSATSTEFHDLSAAANSALLRALAEHRLDGEDWKAIAKLFAESQSRGAPTRKRDSVRIHFHFLRAMAGAELPPGPRGSSAPAIARRKSSRPGRAPKSWSGSGGWRRRCSARTARGKARGADVPCSRWPANAS